MTSWDVASDLATVADQCEVVTWRRPGTEQSATIAHALRRAVTVSEAAASDGKYTQTDCVWHLPAAEVSQPLRLGDLIIRSNGDRYTVLEWRAETVGSRYRCLTRRLEVVHGLTEYVTFQRAEYTRSASGAAKVHWVDALAGVSAKIQPLRTDLQTSLGTFASQATHEVYWFEQSSATSLADANAEYRLIDAEGRIYRLIGFQKARRIDQWSVATVIQTPEHV